jgi:Cys-tRNA(Pro)/Cys-tRNA(Cys) deacylase
MKTNGARFLEIHGIPFELREYDVDPDDLSAIAVAKKVGMPPEQVFKTLLTKVGAPGPGSPATGPRRWGGDPSHLGTGEGKSTGHHSAYAFAVIPGDAELDFKKLARSADWRKAEMASLKDLQPLTGYIRGGVTIFGAKKAYPVFIDETIILFDKISVSAGTRGAQLILSPGHYLRAAESLGQPVTTAGLTKEVGPGGRL